ncbi:hypothetical protein BLA29_003923 [Euroglyphus maynei]|uniref:Uncharacterized protein n=1 Tax=Euroglyphus maynei TaxID=6958 RepID=A0A1Y3AVT9_EURMA|nr:hypothetical protein BLA29_003923 [Euroglyphus maynei]
MYQFQNILYNSNEQNKGKQWTRFRLNRLIEDYINIQKEIAASDKQLRRYLNILFIGFDLLITYLTCLIFLVHLDIDFLLVYGMIYAAHIGLLSVLIFNCSKMVHSNRKFLKSNQKCLRYLKAQNVLSGKYFYKVKRFYFKFLSLLISNNYNS